METKLKGQVAFFDFDGTVTRKDSFIEFVLFDQGVIRFAAAIVLLVPNILAGCSRSLLKERLFTRLYKGAGIDALRAKGDRFGKEVLPKIVRPSALAVIKHHLDANHKVCIVTASSALWLQSFCKELHVDLICTEYEVVDEHITGRYITGNCKGQEKVRRIKNRYNLNQYERVYAYGDTRSDMPMLSIATDSFYKYFTD